MPWGYVMKINLATTILASSALAVLLNIVQWTSHFSTTSHSLFAPSWALASSTQAPAPHIPTLTELPPASGAAPLSVNPPAQPVPTLPTGTASVALSLASAGLNPSYAGLYLTVQEKTGAPWQLLAAVHKVETNQSGNTSETSYAGATGPMQFMPSTFARYAMDGNGDGRADIDNVADAVMTAGHFLAVAGAARGDYVDALYAYNHSDDYVSEVTAIYTRLGL